MERQNNNNKTKMRILIIIGIMISLVSFVSAQDISSDIISSNSITSIVKDLGTTEIIDEIEKIYEIGDSSLKKGSSVILDERDAIRIRVKERDHYIIFWNITEDKKVHIIFPGKRTLSYEEGSIALIDMDQDGKLDVQLELKSIEERKAEIYIKKFIEEELSPSGDYFELFDVTVRLAEEEIYTSRELEAYITFENFGEGISEIDIVYSIIDENDAEVYRGIDNKIIQTEDSVVKDFNFLELPTGKYILRAEIFYGQNQTGESEQDFEIVEVPIMDRLGGPALFIFTILVLGFGVMYSRRNYKKRGKKK